MSGAAAPKLKPPVLGWAAEAPGWADDAPPKVKVGTGVWVTAPKGEAPEGAEVPPKWKVDVPPPNAG